MKTWAIMLFIILAFMAVGLIDKSEYYSFEPIEPNAPVKYAGKPVDNLVENPANVVNNPSPIVWR